MEGQVVVIREEEALGRGGQSTQVHVHVLVSDYLYVCVWSRIGLMFTVRYRLFMG